MCYWRYIRYGCGHKGPSRQENCYFYPDCGWSEHKEEKWEIPCNRCKYKYKNYNKDK
jgi:hypothetical protein